jgi:predicted PurR-regulated permease PerM
MRFYAFFREIYTDEKRFRATIIFCILSALLYLFFSRILDVVLLFLFAFLLALILNPYVKRLRSLGVPRSLGAAMFLLIIISLIVIGMTTLSFFAHKHLVYYSTRIEGPLTFIANWIPNTINAIAEKLHINAEINAEKIREYITNSFCSVIELLLRHSMSLVDHAKALVSMLSSGAIVAILSFYLLKDWIKIAEKVQMYLPNNIVSFVKFAAPDLRDSLKKQICGQLQVCMIMAAVYSTALCVLGIRPYFWVGILSGLLAFIPFIGVVIAFAVALFVGLGQGLGVVPLVLLGICFFVGSSLESNVLTPKLVGNRIGVHPVWIFFAVLTTWAILGLFGVVFVMPIATTTSSLLRSFRKWIERLPSR